MDDIDRIVARDYEPSDQDVVKARLRTVGVQEYHFSISGGKCSTFYASAATPFLNCSLVTGYDDWILYDVGGSRVSVCHIPPLNLTSSDKGGDSETRGRPILTISILSFF